MTINDSFVLFSEGAEIRDAGGGLINPETRGLYEVRTHNDMVGIQAGVEITEKYNSWNWGLRGKAGGFTNFADRESNIETLNGIDSRSEKIDDTNFAFLAEAGVFVAYHIRPNVTLRSAADVIYVPSGTADVQRNLSALGHVLQQDTWTLGNVNAIGLAADGAWLGAADPRRHGVAAGY